MEAHVRVNQIVLSGVARMLLHSILLFSLQRKPNLDNRPNLEGAK